MDFIRLTTTELLVTTRPAGWLLSQSRRRIFILRYFHTGLKMPSASLSCTNGRTLFSLYLRP